MEKPITSSFRSLPRPTQLVEYGKLVEARKRASKGLTRVQHLYNQSVARGERTEGLEGVLSEAKCEYVVAAGACFEVLREAGFTCEELVLALS